MRLEQWHCQRCRITFYLQARDVAAEGWSAVGCPSCGGQLMVQFDGWVNVLGQTHVTPQASGCWYCHRPDGTLWFSREWDTWVHPQCIWRQLAADPTDAEALTFAREYCREEGDADANLGSD